MNKEEKWDEIIRILPKYVYEYGIDSDNPKPLKALTPKEVLDLVAASWLYIEVNNKEIKDRNFVMKHELKSILGL